MKNGIKIFKYTSPVICLLILWLILRDLRCGDGGTAVTRDTVSFVRDTTIYVYQTDTQYIPKPYRVDSPPDTIELEGEPIYRYYPVDSLPITFRNAIRDYYSAKYYLDSFDVQYGKLYLYDTVYKNQIRRKSFSLQQSIPEITNTITLEKPTRTAAFIGLSIAGNKGVPFYAAGVDFGLKFKNDSYLGIEGLLLKDGTPIYGIQYMKKIRLRKR